MAEKTQIEMTQVKITKGTIVFASDDPNSPVTTVYIRKGHGWEDKKQIQMTLESK